MSDYTITVNILWFVIIVIGAVVVSVFSSVKVANSIVKTSKGNKSTSAQSPIHVSNINVEDDSEIVAVLAAAIAAYTGESPDRIHIKSFKRISNSWSQTSTKEQMYNRI